MEQPEKKKGCFILFLLGAAAFVLVAVVVVAVIFFAGPDVPERTVLTVRIGSRMLSKPQGRLEELFMGKRDPSVYGLYKTLKRAASDDRIQGLCLYLQGGSLDFAEACELRRLISTFRSGGRKVIAFGDDLSFRAWYLATACDKILLNPYGSVRLSGIGVRVFMLKDLLEKELGLKADFHRVGRFKSAPEALARDELSEPGREAFRRLVDVMWEGILDDASEARRMKRDKLSALINGGPLSAEAAVKSRLVDKLLLRGNVEDFISGEFGGDAGLFPWSTYMDSGAAAGGGAEIGYVALDGMIMQGKRWFQKQITAEAVLKHLKKLSGDPDVKAVIIRLNSPGGDGLSSARIYQAVMRVRKKKPVVVSMGSSAASGGYYIASAADYIIAQPFTMTGSIGVFGGKIVACDLAEKYGVGWEDFTKGTFAGMYDPLEPYTEKQVEVLKRELGRFYKRFVKDVAKGRGMKVEEIERVAEGRVWIGEDAVKNKLVDALGGMKEAVAKAGELAHISGPAELVLKPPEQSWYGELFSSRAASDDAASLLEKMRLLSIRFFSGRPLTLLPFTVEL